MVHRTGLLPRHCSRHLAISRRIHLCACEVDIEPSVDTVDEDQFRALGVNDFDLACPTGKSLMLAGGVPVPQNLADRLVAVGYALTRVCSSTAGSGSAILNPVVWRWSARRPHRVILAEEKSP